VKLIPSVPATGAMALVSETTLRLVIGGNDADTPDDKSAVHVSLLPVVKQPAEAGDAVDKASKIRPAIRNPFLAACLKKKEPNRTTPRGCAEQRSQCDAIIPTRQKNSRRPFDCSRE
jgi:hypothetical protein